MNPKYRNDFQVIIVLGTDHAGLKPEFKQLEDEMVHTVSVLHSPRDVMHWLREVRAASKLWLSVHDARELQK